MGNTVSSLHDVSKEEVAAAVAAKGANFESYADAVRANGVDGEILASLEGEDELNETFDELGISSKLHRRVLAKTLEKAKKGLDTGTSYSPSVPPPQSVSPDSHVKAAAALNLTFETPSSELRKFDDIATNILQQNAAANYAGVNLILEDGQHPLAGRIREPDGSMRFDRDFAHVPLSQSVCRQLVQSSARDYLIQEMPDGCPVGPTYIGHVLKDDEGVRIGAVCEVGEIETDDRDATQDQILLLSKLASIAEKQLHERRTLLSRNDSLKSQLRMMAEIWENTGEEEKQGPVAAVTAAQVASRRTQDYPMPEDSKLTGRSRDSSMLPAYRQNLASNTEMQHIPTDLFDAVDAAGMPRPPIGKEDFERVAAVEALGLHRMNPNGPTAAALKGLVSSAAQIFGFPMAQISFHNHAREFSLCPYSTNLTAVQKEQAANFIEEVHQTNSTGNPFLCSRGRGNAVCNYPILSKRTFVVHDLWDDGAFTMYRDMKFIRAYVGSPILSAGGHVVALLCMFDFKARPDFSKAHEIQTENVARIIGQNIENWALRREMEQLERIRRLLSMHVDTEKSTPPEGDVTFVFSDVQGSTSLWESNPLAMEAALKVHDDVTRKICAESNGYEIFTEGDAFRLAFHDPVDALKFSLRAQTELHSAAWPKAILAHPDAADDPDNAFHGLRVRMGIHHGPVSTSVHDVTGRTQYRGQTVRLAKSVEAMCHGGQILLTTDAWNVGSGVLEALGSPQVLDLGEHVLMTGSSACDGIIAKRIMQLVPSTLALDYFSARRGSAAQDGEGIECEWKLQKSSLMGRQFASPLTLRQLSPSFHDAPYSDGLVTIAFVFSPGIEALSDEVADVTLRVLGTLIRSLLVDVAGYESKENRGFWMLAFSRPMPAVQFGLSLMRAIGDASFHHDILERAGLLKVGVYSGAFACMGPHPTTGRADYFGPVVNRAARVAGAANPGQVCIGIPASEAESEPPVLGSSITTKILGVKAFKGVKEEMTLFLCSDGTAM